jgi:predicted transcriptional regulator
MKGNILLKQKQTRILVALRDTSQNWYISTLAKATSTTYVHACNFLATCDALGITSSEKHGKLKIIKLTEKGIRLADMLISINSLISVPDHPSAAEPQK